MGGTYIRDGAEEADSLTILWTYLYYTMIYRTICTCLLLSTVSAQWWNEQVEVRKVSITDPTESTVAPSVTETNLLQKIITPVTVETVSTLKPLEKISSESSSVSTTANTELPTTSTDKVIEEEKTTTSEKKETVETTEKNLVKETAETEKTAETTIATINVKANIKNVPHVLEKEKEKVEMKEVSTESPLPSTTPSTPELSSQSSTTPEVSTESSVVISNEVSTVSVPEVPVTSSVSVPQVTSEVVAETTTKTDDVLSKMLKPDLAVIYRRLFNLKPFQRQRI